VTLYIAAGYSLTIPCLLMLKVFVANLCVKEEWNFLYFFLPAHSSASQARTTWSYVASLLHI